MTFDITIDGTDEPTEEGNAVSVNYTVTNSGSSEETQDVELVMDEAGGLPARTYESFEDSQTASDYFTTGDSGHSMDRADIVTTQVIDGDQSAEMLIPSGTQDGPDIVYDFESTWGPTDTAHARWWVYIPDSDATATNTDLKGASLTNSNETTATDGTNHWNCRQEWRDNGDGTFRTQLYIYHADRNDGFGDNTDDWSSDYALGEWHRFDQWVDIGDAGFHDAVFKLWIDGNLEQDTSGWRLRNSGVDLPIRFWWPHLYQNNEAVSADFPVYYDQLRIWKERQPV